MIFTTRSPKSSKYRIHLPDNCEQTARMSGACEMHCVSTHHNAYTHHNYSSSVTKKRQKILVCIYSKFDIDRQDSWTRFVKRQHDI